jgi:hypothetical protein
MAHYAHITEENIVDQVIVAEQDFIDILPDPQNWIQTSYNTRAGVHYDPLTRQPDNGTPLRKNYAGVSFTYDKLRNAFIPPKPYSSWLLNEQTCCWEAPNPCPTDGKKYIWNDTNQQWEVIN